MSEAKTDAVIEDLPLEMLDAAERNPNVMDPEKFEALKAAIERLGFLQPILVRPLEGGRYRIVDGHHRVKALRELGRRHVPAVIDALEDDFERAARLGLNVARGRADLRATAEELAALAAAGWTPDEDLIVTGYGADEVRDLLATLREDEEAAFAGGVDAAAALIAAGAEPAGEAGTFDLTLRFPTAERLRAVRRALKKAAGKGGTVEDGVCRALGLEES